MAVRLKLFRKVLFNMGNINPDKILFEVAKNKTIQAQILDKIFEGQIYSQGVDGAGVSLGNYSPRTIEYKTRIAGGLGYDTRSDHVTLKDTGELYASAKFKNEPKQFVIAADLKKEDTDFWAMYPDLLKTTPDTKEFIAELILPGTIEGIKKQIFKGIR